MRDQFLKHLAKSASYAEQTVDAKTGRFLAPNGGWAVTHQDSILPLALVYKQSGTTRHGDAKLLKLAQCGGDALCDAQDETGQFEFIKIDGSRWGKIYQPWTIYHWCEAYALLRDDLDAKSRARWEKGLTLAYDGLARIYERPVNHNIPTWNGMSLVRGAQVFGNDKWHAVGKRLIEFNAEHLHPHGYWPEGDGPTYGYNRVYLHALGLYHLFTGDKQVLAPIRTALKFLTMFVYPDGTGIAAIDGRQRYHIDTNPMGWPAMMLTGEGQRLVELQWQKHKHCGHGLPAPHIATAWQHYPQRFDAAPLLADKGKLRTVFRGSALLRRHDKWMVCASGYGTPPDSRAGNARNRWIMTRSNCLSVWHDKLGVIIGGGHSKQNALYATFDVWHEGAQRLEPDKATFSQRNGEEVITFHYGPLKCLLRLKPRGSKLDITFELPAATAKAAQVRGGFTIMPEHGSKLRWTAVGKPKVDTSNELDPRRAIGVSWNKGDGYRNRRVYGKGWTLDMPEESTLSYPVYPFNPYAIDDAAPPTDARMSLGTTFTTGRSRTFTLTVL